MFFYVVNTRWFLQKNTMEDKKISKHRIKIVFFSLKPLFHIKKNKKMKKLTSFIYRMIGKVRPKAA